MKNCLITKLKGSVNNQNLPYFGGVEFSLADSNVTGILRVNDGQSAKLISKTDGTIVTITDSQSANLSDLLTHGQNWIFVSAYDAFPRSKNSGYADYGLQGLITNIEQWDKVSPLCLTEICLINNTTISGSLNALPASDALTTINIMGSRLTGDYATLVSKYPNLGKNGGELNLYSNYFFTSDVAGLGGLHYMPSELWISAESYGDFYDAIVGWRQNIGETGTTPSIIGSSQTKLWSVNMQQAVGAIISWTATTSSITINGVTTTFDNNGNII